MPGVLCIPAVDGGLDVWCLLNGDATGSSAYEVVGFLFAFLALGLLAALSLNEADGASVDFFGRSTVDSPVEGSHALASPLEVDAPAHARDAFMVHLAQRAMLVDVLAVAHFEGGFEEC